MISDPITVEPDEPMQNALTLMKDYRISGVPVAQGRKLVGILTNRDLLLKLISISLFQL